MSTKPLYSYIRHEFSARKSKIAALSALTGVVAVADASLSFATKTFIDEVITRTSGVPFIVYGVVFLLLILTISIGGGLFRQAGAKLASQITCDLRVRTFRRMLDLPFYFFNRRPVFWFSLRLNEDSSSLGQTAVNAAVEATWFGTYFILVNGCMIFLNWKLGCLIPLLVILLLSATYWAHRLSVAALPKMMAFHGQMHVRWKESLLGARELKAFAREDVERREFSNILRNVQRSTTYGERFTSLPVPLVLFFNGLATGLILAVGGPGVIAGTMSMGTLVAFIYLVSQLFWSVNQFCCFFIHIQWSLSAAERHFETMGDAGPASNGSGSARRNIKQIEFRNVSFRYEENTPYVLNDISFTAVRGQTIALVGPSGGGKTTLVSLLAKFYEPERGKILVDGQDFGTLPAEGLKLGIVSQTPHFFSDSVLENIRFGRPGATKQEVFDAARTAGADGFITGLPDGYETRLSGNGSPLTGGQKQLVALCRALLVNPNLLLLDEVGASLDHQSEGILSEAVASLATNRFVFVVAHRLHTVRRASQILFIEKGMVCEAGTHEELMAQRGRYFQFCETQRVAAEAC